MEWMLSSSVLILVILLIRRLTLGRISMRLRYALWALVLVRLLIPFSFGSTPVSIMNTAQQVPVIQDAQVLHDIQHIEHTYGGAVEGYSKGDYLADAPTVIAEHKSDEEFTRMTTVLNLRDILIPLWKIGVLVLAVLFWAANLRFRAVLRKTRTRLEAPDFPLPVYVTTAVETPCLFGLIHPAVYVTPEVQSDPKALRYALEHELTHFYQRDFLWSILRCICICLHWFNPLVWLAVHLSRQDAELSCDEGTIRRIGEEQRIAYGNTLIDLTCTQHRPSDLLYAATTMTGSKKSIRERVTFIARCPKNLTLAALAVVLVTAVAVGCTFTGADKPTEEPGAVPEPLTQEELAYFQENYFSSGYSIANQFLTSLYTRPEDINLFELFYNGTTLPGGISDAEIQAVLDAYPDIWADTDCTKLHIKDMDTILEQYTGLHFNETRQRGMENLAYLEQYDAYYHFHGDTNAQPGPVFTAGFRQGNQVSLYYEDKMVTLVKAGDSWHILSNRYAPTPTAAAQVPDEEPFLTVPVASLDTVEPQVVETEPFTRQEWGQLVGDLFYQGTDDQPNRSILTGVWPDGSIYACYVVYDNAAGEETYHRFLQLCDQEMTAYYLDHPEELSIRSFMGLLGRNGFSVNSQYGVFHYFFNEAGQLCRDFLPLVPIEQQFSARNTVYTFSDDATGQPELLVWNGTALQHGNLVQLLQDALPDMLELTLNQVEQNGVGLYSYYDTDISSLTHRHIRVACDGETLLFYHGDGKTYTDGIADDIDVPDVVVQQAKQAARSELSNLVEQYPDMASLDDWRISDIYLDERQVVDGISIELYTPQIRFHTSDPDHFKVPTTDGWFSLSLGYFAHDHMLFLNTQTGLCIPWPGGHYTTRTISSLLEAAPELRHELLGQESADGPDLWAFREGDPARLGLMQGGESPVFLENDWTVDNASHLFSVLQRLEWTPCDPPGPHDQTPSVTLETEQFDLVVYAGTRIVEKIEGDAVSYLEAEQTGDMANAPYEILRDWFDELEWAELSAEEIVIPDRGQTWQEAAQEYTQAYYSLGTKATPGSHFCWTYAKAEILPMEAEAEQAMKQYGYIGKESHPFFARVVFVPENQRAYQYSIAGNTGNYEGDNSEVPANALEWSRCATVEKRDDGWHGEIRGTGW